MFGAVKLALASAALAAAIVTATERRPLAPVAVPGSATELIADPSPAPRLAPPLQGPCVEAEPLVDEGCVGLGSIASVRRSAGVQRLPTRLALASPRPPWTPATLG